MITQSSGCVNFKYSVYSVNTVSTNTLLGRAAQVCYQLPKYIYHVCFNPHASHFKSELRVSLLNAVAL